MRSGPSAKGRNWRRACDGRHVRGLPADVVAKGLIAGTAPMTGSFFAGSVVLRMQPATFRMLVDGLMLSSGLSLLWAAAR